MQRRDPKERSIYIPRPERMAEAILCRLVTNFPWLMSDEISDDQEECDDFIDAFLGEIAMLSAKDENQAKRIMVMLRDRADFGPPPARRRYGHGDEKRKTISEE